MDRDMLKFALPLMAVSLFSMMSHWLDIVMLGYFCDTRTVGLYQPAARTAGMIRSVLLAFAGIAAPMIAEFHGKRQVQEIQKVYDLVTRWILMLIIPPVLLMVIIPEQVLSIFGRQFAGSSTALILLSAAALMQAFFGLGSTVLAMTGLERLSFVNQAVALLVQVLLSMLLIPAFGMNGAAISSLMVIGLLSLARAAELHVFLRIRMFSRALWKPLTAGAISGLAMLIARTWIEQLVPVYGLLAGIAVSWGIYALLIRKFRLEQEELDVIFRFMPFLKKESKQETL
jgi:O-antigen/teichoic acid export membrane protein